MKEGEEAEELAVPRATARGRGGAETQSAVAAFLAKHRSNAKSNCPVAKGDCRKMPMHERSVSSATRR